MAVVRRLPRRSRNPLCSRDSEGIRLRTPAMRDNDVRTARGNALRGKLQCERAWHKAFYRAGDARRTATAGRTLCRNENRIRRSTRLELRNQPRDLFRIVILYVQQRGAALI